MAVFKGHILTVAFKTVKRTDRLVRIGFVLCLCQAARHPGLRMVIVKVCQQLISVTEGIAGFQDDVINIGIVIILAVALAVQTGVEQQRTCRTVFF